MIYPLIGRRVKKAREAKGWTQDQLASSVAYSRTSMVNLEQGVQKIPIETLYWIADALDVELHTLLPSLQTLRKAQRLIDHDE